MLYKESDEAKTEKVHFIKNSTCLGTELVENALLFLNYDRKIQKQSKVFFLVTFTVSSKMS